MEPVIQLLVLGVVAGIVSAMLGVGSGIVLVPAMVIFFALPQKSAQGIALTVMVPMALVGAARYIFNPQIEVNLKWAALIAAGAVVGALIGSTIAAKVPGPILKKVFAIFLLIAAARMLWPARSKPASPPESPATRQSPTQAGQEGP